jgi:hypothetical protein
MAFARKTPVPLSQSKQRTASGMRALAGKIDDELPGMAAPQHLRDAARALESGNHAGSKRHLMAAMHTMTPLSLMRHGILDDDGHAKAKVNMDLINRHHMLVSDLEDGEAHNNGLRAVPATFTQPSNLPMGDSMNPQKLPGAAGPDGGPGLPKTVKAAMNPAPAQNSGIDRAMAGGPKAPSGKERQLPGRPTPQAVLSWDDIDRMVELSAQTARLAATPAPRGKPGGPGLYDVEGMGHTAYLQQIVKALIEKRGMKPGKAYAVARGAIRRWSSGGGKVHPEVRAAAAAAEGGELAKQARAKAVHGHTADSWAGVVELVGTAAGAASDPRAANGTFGAGGSSAPAPAAPQQSAKQAAAQKAQLLAKAKADRAKAAALVKQLAALTAASAATTAATAKATKAGTTGKTASPTPAKKTAAAPAAPAAAAKKTASGAGAASKAAAPATTKAQQVAALKTQISALLTQASQATAMAGKL